MSILVVKALHSHFEGGDEFLGLAANNKAVETIKKVYLQSHNNVAPQFGFDISEEPVRYS